MVNRDQVEQAWTQITSSPAPKELWQWMDDLETIVSFLGGDLNSRQIVGLTVLVFWRFENQSRQETEAPCVDNSPAGPLGLTPGGH